jgi:hypothetical protein
MNMKEEDEGERERKEQQQTDERMIYMAIACFVLLHISLVNHRSAAEI